ncbi:transmembrane protein 192 isoform X2 [Nilaparvata lugens]|uniref:transmembrane protein 192 isoform X2 n=1 Tax=Nilaparvata lugens TaxID=108931 RepID=UPI00193EC18A|nr:transmembrane protein 192 isoform X2 [Nilaparvata lugens]
MIINRLWQEQMDSDLEYLQPVLNTPTQHYGYVKTIWVSVSYIFLTVILEIIAVTVYVNWPSNSVQCEPLFYFLYGHAAFWILTVIFDHYLKWRHHSLYLNGYLDFSEQLKKISSFPLQIISLWNAVLLAVVAWYHQTTDELEKACSETLMRSPVGGVLTLISIEAVLLIVLVANYLYKVYHFNSGRRLPDVEISSDWAPLHTFVSDELGFKESINGVEDLLLKQANRIRFYKNESEALKRKIATLSNFQSEAIN